MISIGLVGSPNVGKSTLFNALQNRVTALTATHAFTTIETNRVVIEVTDPNLSQLAQTCNSTVLMPETIEILDVAGLIENAHTGAGLGNEFLHEIRKVDAIFLVLRGFHLPDSPEDDLLGIPNLVTVILELCQADRIIIAREREKKVMRRAAGGDKIAVEQRQSFRQMEDQLKQSIRLSEQSLSEKEKFLLDNLGTITDKPTGFILNNSSDTQVHVPQWVHPLLTVDAKIEEELQQLTAEDRKAFMELYGISTLFSEQLIVSLYKLLGLITIYGCSETAIKAWTVPKGTKSREAASLVHTDFGQRVTKTEAISANELIDAGSMETARKNGRIRIESKDYTVQDEDVLYFQL